MVGISVAGNDIAEQDLIDRAEEYESSHDLDDPDQEALGAAVYLEEVVSGEGDGLGGLAEYIAQSQDFNFSEFVEYKAEMGNDYSQFSGRIGGVMDEMSSALRRNEAVGSIYQALYEEAVNERQSASSALGDLLDRASEAETDTEWADQALEGFSPEPYGTRRGIGLGGNFSMNVIGAPFGEAGFGCFSRDTGPRETTTATSWDDFDWGGWEQVGEPAMSYEEYIKENGADGSIGRGRRTGRMTQGMGVNSPIIYNPQIVTSSGISSSSWSRYDVGDSQDNESEDLFDGMDMPWGDQAS